VRGTDPGGDIRDFQAWRYPIEIGVRRKQGLELIGPLLARIPVRLDQQFRHGNRGRYALVVRLFEPCEDVIGERYIARIGFQLVDENARIERDPPMAPQKSIEGQLQLWRSF